MKKKLLFLVAAFALFVPSVMAAELTAGTTDELTKAINNASSGDTIKLTANINDDNLPNFAFAIKDNKEITLNMNNYSITAKTGADYPIFAVYKGGKLNITGKGTIKSANTDKGYVITVYGNGTNDAKQVNKLNVGKDITLDGYNGIMIQGLTNADAYNVEITFEGKIKASSKGIYVNGTIKNTDNIPVINIKDGASIESALDGIYAAGNATWEIGKATITGVEAGLAIKSGVFNIDGAIVKGTGEDKRPTEGNNNGINPSGAAIQIESNANYAGNIELNIKDGTFTSDKGVVVYEYLDSKTTKTAVKEVKVENGTFTSAENKPVMYLSKEFVKEHTETEFIEGGTYKSGTKETIVETLTGDYLPVEETVTLTTYSYVDNNEDEKESFYVAKGTILSEEFEAAFKKLVEEDGKYVYNGAYLEKELKTKYDFTKEINEDTSIYFSISTVKEEPKKEETPKDETTEETKKEENPDTGDINLALIIGTILVGTLGVVVTSKKISAKVTR